jgi:hypothetical protein
MYSMQKSLQLLLQVGPEVAFPVPQARDMVWWSRTHPGQHQGRAPVESLLLSFAADCVLQHAVGRWASVLKQFAGF